MKKNEQLKIVNALLAGFFAVQATTGLAHGVLPQKLFYFVHEWAGKGLILMAIIHIVYNFGWIRSSYFKKKTQPE